MLHTARRAAVLALGRLSDYHANAVLGCALIDRDQGARTLAENGIRRLWMCVGMPTQQQRMAAIVEATDDKDYQRAIELARYSCKKHRGLPKAGISARQSLFSSRTIRGDCQQTLEINAYPFVAASIMGQAFLQLGNPVVALESFRRALWLNLQHGRSPCPSDPLAALAQRQIEEGRDHRWL